MTVIAKKLKSRGELPWRKLKKEETKEMIHSYKYLELESTY